jgi:hypothetical protein
MWVATSAGVARIDPAGTVATFELSDLGSGVTDVRDLAVDGTTVWLATAAGVVEFASPRDRTVHAGPAGITDVDCRAIAASDGEVWVGTASDVVARGRDGRWTARAVGVGPAAALSGSWSAPAFIDHPAAGERDPHLVQDGGTVLLAAARRHRSATGDTWQLTLRRREPGAAGWTDPVELTVAGAIDREPAIVRVPAGPLQVYFRSNRGGGARIWRLEVSGAGAGSQPAPVTTGPSTDTDPALLALGATSWLLLRSDRNVALAGVAGANDTTVPQAVSTRRFAGSATAIPADLARNGGAGTFGELLDYTPQRPRGDAPSPAERYTPGTIAVFFDPAQADQPVGPTDTQRLRQLLTEFLPASVRVVTIPNV